MAKETVMIFRPYEFKAGQKIHVESGPRKGDWEVLGLTDRKIKLRCPISLKTFEWNRFCYLVEECKDAEWPRGE